WWTATPSTSAALCGSSSTRTGRSASRTPSPRAVLRSPGGEAARDFLARLLPVGTKCRLATERDVTTFGRYVASIELEDGRDVATALI
ncbi:MAG: hypothetical protein AVDCRST_MAG01-01-4789, partial [uncultured Rubrobacteraceae bacterium]